MAFLVSLIYSYLMMIEWAFVATVFWGIILQVYSAMLWVFMIYDRVRYHVPLFVGPP